MVIELFLKKKESEKEFEYIISIYNTRNMYVSET